MQKLTFGLVILLAVSTLAAGDLVRAVRNKISAGDIPSCQHLVEDYKHKTGVDAEYLDAMGWLARSAEMLGQNDLAASYVAELRREIQTEKEEWLAPLGAAIEVEGKLRAKQTGRKAAVKFLEAEFARAKDIGLRSRIRKNINFLSLEKQPALEVHTPMFVGAAPPTLAAAKGHPVLLFCGRIGAAIVAPKPRHSVASGRNIKHAASCWLRRHGCTAQARAAIKPRPTKKKPTSKKSGPKATPIWRAFRSRLIPT
jgi:hypothetical protein